MYDRVIFHIRNNYNNRILKICNNLLIAQSYRIYVCRSMAQLRKEQKQKAKVCKNLSLSLHNMCLKYVKIEWKYYRIPSISRTIKRNWNENIFFFFLFFLFCLGLEVHNFSHSLGCTGSIECQNQCCHLVCN